MENALSTHRAEPRTLLGRVAFALLLYVVFDGFSHGMFDVSLAPTLSLTLLALLVSAATVVGEAIVDREFPLPKPWTMPLLLVVFVGYVAYSSTRGVGTFDLSFVKNLVLVLLILALVRTPRDLLLILGAAAASGLFQAMLGIGQLTHLGAIPEGGLSGTLPNHVQYAVYLLLSLTAASSLILAVSGWGRVPIGFGMGLMAAVALMSLARGVVVAALIVAVVASVILARRRRVALGWIVAVLAFGFAVTLISGRIGTILDIPAAFRDPQRLDLLLNNRLPLLIAAWNMFLSAPLLGVGYGSFPALWTQYVAEDVGNIWIRRLELAAHSTYLQIMAELGVVGITLYTGLLALGLRYSYLVTRMRDSIPRETWSAAVGVLLGILAIVVHGVLDNTGWHDRVLYVFLGLAVSTWTLAQESRRPA